MNIFIKNSKKYIQIYKLKVDFFEKTRNFLKLREYFKKHGIYEKKSTFLKILFKTIQKMFLIYN